MFKFIRELEDGSYIEFRVAKDSDLTAMCEAFEDFLKGCGYKFTGKIDIVEVEESNE